MKKLKRTLQVSVVVLMALSSQSYAGGDILPVAEYFGEEEQVIVESTPFVESIPAVVESKQEVVVEKVEKKVVEVVPPIVTPSAKPWYAGVGLTAGRVSDTHCEDITYGAMAKVGYDFNDYIGVEARGVKTNWEYEGAKIEHVGIFLKPMIPVGEKTNIYGLVGYGKTTTNHKKKVDEKGLALGAGLAYDIADKSGLGVFVDYERLLQKSNVPDLDAVSFGLSYSF